jgi:hypothetical protein
MPKASRLRFKGNATPVSEAVRQIGVTVQTYYRWRKEYGGMSRDQLKRLKELSVKLPALFNVFVSLLFSLRLILLEIVKENSLILSIKT